MNVNIIAERQWIVQILLTLQLLKFQCLYQGNYRLILSTSVEKRNPIKIFHMKRS